VRAPRSGELLQFGEGEGDGALVRADDGPPRPERGAGERQPRLAVDQVGGRDVEDDVGLWKEGRLDGGDAFVPDGVAPFDAGEQVRKREPFPVARDGRAPGAGDDGDGAEGEAPAFREFPLLADEDAGEPLPDVAEADEAESQRRVYAHWNTPFFPMNSS